MKSRITSARRNSTDKHSPSHLRTIRRALAVAAIVGSATLGTDAFSADYVPPAETRITDWTGGYIGVFGGAGGIVHELSGGGGSFNGVGGEGAIVGVMGGLNYQLSEDFLLGVQGELGLADLETEATVLFGLASIEAAPEFMASVSARAGWLVNPDTLFYVIGGYSYMEYEVEAGALFGIFQAEFDEKFHGFHVGAGVETKITDNISARLEYRYTQFSDEDFGTGGLLEVEPSIHAGLLGIAYNFYANPYDTTVSPSADYFGPVDRAAPDWTGLYIGGYFGGGAVVNDITALPGIGIGTFFNGVGGEGFVGGGMIGFNYQFDPRFVVGLQGEIGVANTKTELSIGGGLFSLEAEPEYTASISARGGWLVTPETMLYVIGGYTFTEYDVELSALGGAFTANVDESFGGIHIGGGVEVALTEQITGRVEYRYTEFESESFGTGGLLGIEPSIHAGTVGLAWNFGNPGNTSEGLSFLSSADAALEGFGGDGELTVTAALESELRVYKHVGRLPGQETGHLFPAVGGWVKADYRWNGGTDRVTVMPYARGDLSDTNRDLIDLPEAYYLHEEAYWDLLIGSHVVYWGVAESRHLVNVVNQTDITADVDEENKLGQPMINLNVSGGDAGTLSLFGLFGFRERDFPNVEDRLRPFFTVSEDNARFEGDKFERHVNFAARYTNTFSTAIGSLDVGASYFYGTNREARFVAGPGFQVIPVYDMMHQVGVEGLYAINDLQLKFEGIYRDTRADNFFAGVGGFEYTLHGAFGTGYDIGLLAEYLFDDRNTALTTTSFEDDVFIGTRVSFNDPGSTALLVGAIFDVDDSSTFVSAELSHRILDDLLLEVEARAFVDIDPSDPLAFLNPDDFAQIRLTKFF